MGPGLWEDRSQQSGSPERVATHEQDSQSTRKHRDPHDPFIGSTANARPTAIGP